MTLAFNLPCLDPENRNGEVLSKEEYLRRKESIEKEKNGLKTQLENFDKFQNERLELTVKTFEFCRRLQKFFEEASPEKKRQTLKVLGSNLSLFGGIIRLDLKKPFARIEKGLEESKGLFEPPEMVSEKGEKVSRDSLLQNWLATRV